MQLDWSNPAALSASVLAIVRNDLRKIMRFAAVAMFTVPLGLMLFWLLLRSDLDPVVANLIAVAVSTIPNYMLNRRWVWQKRGPNSVSREVAPFWAMSFLGLIVSTVFVWFAGLFTQLSLVFLVANLTAFGIVWVFKFFIIEKFLFGHAPAEVAESRV